LLTSASTAGCWGLKDHQAAYEKQFGPVHARRSCQEALW
jgi:hypothetical protein